MGKLFGTDGIRGVANETLDTKLAYRIGQAAAKSWDTSIAALPARRPVSASTSRSRSSRIRCRSRACFKSSRRSIQSPFCAGQMPHIRFS